MYDAAVGAVDAHMTAERLFRLVSNYPSVVEPGLTITTREENVQDQAHVDFVCDDSEGRSVAVEIKWLGQRSDMFTVSRNFADQFEEVADQFDRVILATNLEPTEKQLERLQELGLEHRTIDEYQVFGHLSGIIRWLDTRINLLGRVVTN
jgi:RecB family endonuclease NucS